MNFSDLISRFPNPQRVAGGFMVRCPAHEDKKPSLGIKEAEDGRILINCLAGCSPEQVCAAIGLTIKDLFPETMQTTFSAKNQHKATFKPQNTLKTDAASVETAPKEKPVIEKTYSYTDALGNELFQVVRLKPKDFRQRHRVDRTSDKWAWSMNGVERVLYRLPEVLKAQTVWVVEGEKDADNLVERGICATTNVGGAGKWLDGYTESLAGKDVIICGDNDKDRPDGTNPGRDHVNLVFESIAQKAKSVKIVKLPAQFKDISDFLVGKNGTADSELKQLVAECVAHYGGVKMPLYSMADIEPKYKTLVRSTSSMQLDLSKWLPSFKWIRPLVPGNVALFVADTKVGKTAVLQNLILFAAHLKTIFFQMELSDEELYERFLAIKTKIACKEIERGYKETDDEFGPVFLASKFPHFLICPEPKLTPERVEKMIVASELKIGEKPRLVVLDYVQLMRGKGQSRYERSSDVAESLKEIAKTTKTIVVVTSQVQRPPSDQQGWQPSLHSAKDSGSFENSATLVVGISRDNNDSTLMKMKVLAATRGGAGLEVFCNFNGETMAINERSKAIE